MFRRLGSAVSLLLGVCLATSASAQKDRFEVGESVPVFTLKSVNPEDSGGDAYIGVDRYFGEDAKEKKKGVLVSFFATYCEPCKKEMPFLAALQKEFGPKGLQVLSVSIDKEPDKIEFIRDLAKKSGVEFPVLSDRFNIVAKRYLIEKLPCVYLINGEGNVAMVQIGYNDDISKEILAQIRNVLGEPATAPVPESLAQYVDHSGGTSLAKADAKDAEEASVEADDSTDKKKKRKKRKKRKRRKKRRRR